MSERQQPRKNVKQVSTLVELKALSHPIRMRLLYSLKAHGPLTATRLGEMVDESPASVSYHLRKLADSGFAEETENASGDGRQRWWCTTSQGFSWSATDFSDSPDGVTAADAAKAVMLEHRWSRLTEYGRTAASWGPEWSDAGFSADNLLHLDPSQTEALSAELLEVVERYRALGANTQAQGATTVMVLLHGFPTQM
ncbi:transcriptional regulator [Rhodococcoides trifolii]|uniref:Transcriptional regulator n=1 Tax=Rhodococcoides trifolii TaxID=908250 RepID=A0A917G8I5_9NOCA|nr:winged helix-turn-helix domain-containing protein [Rhodococcus trifolii]GGG27384.1 transcriptional regulator [Rhodococcus trifolii]